MRDNPVGPDSPFVSLETNWSALPLRVPLPLRLWNSRCLILNGFADVAALNAELVRRKAQPVNDKFFPDALSSRGLVQLYGSDYIGTTLGPFKSVFTLTWVKSLTGASGAYFMWGPYFGNSLINKEFKEQVWGIRPNHLAVVETAYYGRRKAVRLLENGRTALRMAWNSARFPDLVEAQQHLVFKTVAPSRTDNGENDVELGAISLKRGDANGFDFPFDGRDDDFDVDQTSELGKYLKRIDFIPATWQCMLNYGGVVKIYDKNGSGKPTKSAASKSRKKRSRKR